MIETDHGSLKRLMEAKTPRLIRWACRLSEFDFVIKYRPGRSNQNADTLSRLPVDNEKIELGRSDVTTNFELKDNEGSAVASLSDWFYFPGEIRNKIIESQKDDPVIKKIVQ